MKFSEVFGPLKWHMVSCAAVFYLLPLLQFAVPQEYASQLAMFINGANSAVITVTSIILTIRSGFKWYYAFVVFFLYMPSLMIYYNFSALISAVSYFVMTYISQIIGVIIGKIIERNA